MKLKEVAERYCYENILSEATSDTYHRRVKAFERKINYDCVTELNIDHVYLWRDIMMKEGLRHTTINNYLRHCRVIWQFGIEKGLIPSGENIFSIKKLPEIYQNRVILDSTIDIALKHLSARNRWFWQSVIKTQAELGIRNKQLISIKVGHIDIERKLIYLCAEGNKLRRDNILPLSDRLVAALELFFQFSDITLGKSLDNDDYIFNIARYDSAFKMHQNKQMSCEQLQGMYHRLSVKIQKITGERISGHRLRHTLATQIGSQPDINIRVVQEWFGWNCIQTAQKYIKVSVDQKRALIEKSAPRRFN